MTQEGEKATINNYVTVYIIAPFVILQSERWREENVPKHTDRVCTKETAIKWVSENPHVK